MTSSIEKLEGLSYKLTIEVPADIIEKAITERLKALRPRVRIDGFRPGKVPPHIIKQRYGQSVRQEVLEQQIDKTYREALEEHKQVPVAFPHIDLQSGMKDGEALKFSATFEVMPEVEVKGLDKLEITLPKSKITAQDVDEMIETLRKQQASFKEADSKHKAAESDRITIDFVGRLDGEEFDGGSAKDSVVIIGSQQMLPDFEDGLKGMKTGEEKTFDVTFPENYGSEKLAGKTAQFSAVAKKIEIMELPELDEAFIERFGVKEKELAGFKKAVQENMERELDNAQRRIRRERLFDAIIAQNGDLVIPHSALDAEMNRMGEQIGLSRQVPDQEQRHHLLHQLFEGRARRRLQLALLIGKLFEEHKLELDKARFDARLDTIASTYEDPAEVKEWYQKDEESRRSLESAVLEEQLVDALYEKAKVTEEEKTFQEIMALNSQLQD